MTDADLRYTFACPNCAGSFSIGLAKIPPVRARFSCPKCGKPMDFPSREEARVYLQLQAPGVGAPAPPTPPAPSAPTERARPAPAASAEPTAAPEAEKQYTVEKVGFENDIYDRRAMRILIRTGALNEADSVRVGGGEKVRAVDLPELKSLFELRKTSRLQPPPVCRKHTDRMAHYVCGDTGRPLCEECAPEKKFGGTSVRVCDHCGGTSAELPAAPQEP